MHLSNLLEEEGKGKTLRIWDPFRVVQPVSDEAETAADRFPHHCSRPVLFIAFTRTSGFTWELVGYAYYCLDFVTQKL